MYVWAMEQEINKVKSKYLKEKEFVVSQSHTDNESKSHSSDTEAERLDSDKHIQWGNSEISSHVRENPTNRESRKISVDSLANMTSKENSEIANNSTGKKNITDNEDCDVKYQSSMTDSDSKLKHEQTTEDSKKYSPSLEQLTISSSETQCNSQISSEQCSREPRELVVHKNRTHFQQQDLLVPWQLRGRAGEGEQVFHRFYHVFQRGELERLCGQVEGCQVMEGYYDQGNWAVILQKV